MALVTGRATAGHRLRLYRGRGAVDRSAGAGDPDPELGRLGDRRSDRRRSQIGKFPREIADRALIPGVAERCAGGNDGHDGVGEWRDGLSVMLYDDGGYLA